MIGGYRAKKTKRNRMNMGKGAKRHKKRSSNSVHKVSRKVRRRGSRRRSGSRSRSR
jgi:hypothetical protein